MGKCWGLTKMQNFLLKKSYDSVSLNGKFFSDAWLCWEQAGAPTSPPGSHPTERYFDFLLNFVPYNFVSKIYFVTKKPFFSIWQVSCGVLIQPSLSTVVEAAGEDLYEVYIVKKVNHFLVPSRDTLPGRK
jgi:hypothetical protein